jgi:UDP-galactopyranose mutase
MTYFSAPSIFRSYWQGGYEGADHINGAGDALSMNDANQHAARAYEDYQLLGDLGIKTVRESIGWRLVEKDGVFDFSPVEPRVRAAKELGIQVIWTFCHYGWPDDVDVYAPSFIHRFVVYCQQTARFLAAHGDENPIYSLMNEISFACWSAAENRFMCAHYQGDGGAELKRQMVRATIKGCDAVWEINPRIRILHCDPLVHVLPPVDRPDMAHHAHAWRASQYEAFDMLCGAREPELGGAPRYLDLIGVNYYHNNQWEIGAQLWWHLANPRRIPLHHLLVEVYQRYQRPLLLAETSHVGSGRGAWIKEVAQEAVLARQRGVDLQGICLYPIIDRPDWDNANYWHNSGMWDVNFNGGERILSKNYLLGLQQAQRLTNNFFPNQISKSMLYKGSVMSTLIVFSHLRWDFVYQRPQHLLTRLAEYYQVFFVEEPIFSQGEARFEISTPVPNVNVCKPFTPVDMPGFHDDQLPHLQKLIRDLVEGQDQIVWLYTPMALPLLQGLSPKLVVYDCMDELSAFKHAPKQMLQRENALLKLADVVFTGGPSLYRAKRDRHPNVHCFPSSVDIVHFEQALDPANHHPAQDHLSRPRLGFYGVIDERLDMDLIAAVADAHPEWQIVLVGPVVKIDQAALPHRPNIHYMGQQPYKVLPQFLAGWDVCLLPFALNESTRFISPTKTLEYMAAELPVVSTPVLDVVELYGDAVAIAQSAEAFISACENALTATPQQRLQAVGKMRELIAQTSWESTAEKMHGLMEEMITRKASPFQRSSIKEADKPKKKLLPSGNEKAKGCVIIGAGPTGLSAAYHLGQDTLLLDKNPVVGGWCRSIEDQGFTFDYAGHIMFSKDDYVLELYQILLGDNLHWQDREAWVYSKGVHTRYPFQGALYGLPPKVIKECIAGAIEARYGKLGNSEEKAPGCNVTGPDPKDITDCCADGTVTVMSSKSVGQDKAASKQMEPANFEDFIYKMWGRGIAEHFAIPYNRKLWTVPLKDMETSWLGGRVPLPDLEEIIEGALEPVGKPMGPNARFGYPLVGGFQALMTGFLPHLKGEIELGASVSQISPKHHLLALEDGRVFRYDTLISTMPLPALINIIGSEAPDAVRDAAKGLRHISVRCVNLGVARENITDKHWIYYPEETLFHRIFVQGNASPGCNPPGGFGLTCEISYSPLKPLPLDGQELIDRCVEDCIKVGLLTAEDKLITANLVDMPYAYVIYDHNRAKNVATIKKWLLEYGIVLSGRYSEWEYYNSDHAFLAGKRAAETVDWMQRDHSLVVE